MMLSATQENQFVRCNRLTFLEQPGFSNQEVRPLSVSLDQRKFDRLQDLSQNGRNFSAAAFEDVAPDILRPSARSEGAALIPDGWNSPRLSFMLDVSLMNNFSMVERRAIITGYTDHYGVTERNGQPVFDPRMRLYFNNITYLAVNVVKTPGGDLQRVSTINSEQVMRPTIVPQSASPAHREFSMRPTDVMVVSGSAEMMQQQNTYVENYLATFHDGVKLNDRRDMCPSEYLSRTITKYARANQQVDGDVYDTVSIAESAAQMLNTNPVMRNDLIVLLQNKLQFNNIDADIGSISYSELCSLDPNTDRIAQMANLKPQPRMQRCSMMNDSRSWNGADNETIAASMISQVLPSLIHQYSLGKIRFDVTNDTVNGAVIFGWKDLKGFNQSLDMSTRAPMLQDAIICQIFNPITAHGQMVASLTVDCDITSHLDILISLNHGPIQPFGCATCADQLFTQFVTRDYNNVAQMASDISTIAQEMSQLQYQPSSPIHSGANNAGYRGI